MMERKVRSVIKALSWRFIATGTTALIVLVLTQDFWLAGKAGLLDVSIKLVLYYLHERGWGTIEWGTEIGNPRSMLDGFSYTRKV